MKLIEVGFRKFCLIAGIAFTIQCPIRILCSYDYEIVEPLRKQHITLQKVHGGRFSYIEFKAGDASINCSSLRCGYKEMYEDQNATGEIILDKNNRISGLKIKGVVRFNESTLIDLAHRHRRASLIYLIIGLALLGMAWQLRNKT